MASPLVTKDQIQELPRKYAIGKRPLSKVLGWGELTYTRIMDGSTPSDEHAREIVRALEDPVTFSMLLENANNKGALTPMCYEKSRKAVDSFLQNESEVDDIVKLHEVGKALCVLTEGEATSGVLQILIYFAIGMSLKTLGSPILEQMPVASSSGPAYPELDEWFTYERIQEHASADLSGIALEAREMQVLERTVEEYGIYSRRGLQAIACEQAPWVKARKKAMKAGEDSVAITLKSMRKYFAK